MACSRLGILKFRFKSWHFRKTKKRYWLYSKVYLWGLNVPTLLYGAAEAGGNLLSRFIARCNDHALPVFSGLLPYILESLHRKYLAAGDSAGEKEINCKS